MTRPYSRRRQARPVAWILPLILFAPAIALAQTGPELLLKPWPKGQHVQAQGEFAMLGEGSTEATDEFDLTFYDLSGRVRLLSEQRADPRFGFNYTHLNTSGDPRLPSQLVDTSIGLGVGIADWSGWLAGITVGLGYAGAGAFDDVNAWYGMADFAIGREFDQNTAFGFVLNYDGNRTIFPDIPLPGFQYRKKLDNALLLAVGFPFSSIEYRPTAALTISGTYYIPDDLTVRADYKLAEYLAMFGEFKSRREAFHWDALSSGTDRLIYESRRAELGLRWMPQDGVSLIVAGGYVFTQEFNVGFDTRDQDRLAEPSDEPYLRIGLEVSR